MTTTSASTTIFSKPTPCVWHLDVPVTYPVPPAGHYLSIGLATPSPLTRQANADPEIVIACAGGRVVWAAEVMRQSDPTSQPMVLLPSDSPSVNRIHLTTALICIIDSPIHTFCQPEHEPLAQEIADLSDAHNIPGPALLGAATQLDASIARGVCAILGPVENARVRATGCEPNMPPISMTSPRRGQGQGRIWCATQVNHPYWALEVPHNYCPPRPHHRLTVFMMTVGHQSPVHPGDLVFAFARERLTMVARVIGSRTPPELKMSIEISADPKDCRSFVTTAEIEVLDIYPDDLYEQGDDLLLDELRTYLGRFFPCRNDLSNGDARPFNDALGNWIASTLELDEAESATAIPVRLKLVSEF